MPTEVFHHSTFTSHTWQRKPGVTAPLGKAFGQAGRPAVGTPGVIGGGGGGAGEYAEKQFAGLGDPDYAIEFVDEGGFSPEWEDGFDLKAMPGGDASGATGGTGGTGGEGDVTTPGEDGDSASGEDGGDGGSCPNGGAGGGGGTSGTGEGAPGQAPGGAGGGSHQDTETDAD